ncbi:MAG: RtcB family protein, partial [Methylobacteriaceae bacterium]|nr:RtcB family protein [Methylobacteriaceae bacterium]
LAEKYPVLNKANTAVHLGTLGTGNHFLEISVDEDGRVWVMLHSGSRGIGSAIGSLFMAEARLEVKKYFITLPDDDLAYLPEGTELFADYISGVQWAQRFAKASRAAMLTSALATLAKATGKATEPLQVVDCHHNYVEMENHMGKNVYVTRKGATRARKGEFGIIPGSMGAKSFIVRGKGDAESFTSCSHGAGRAMSRSEAKRRFSVDDHIRDTAGVECRKDADVIDETPGAYKNIDAVMAAQADLVEVVHTLKQVVCVKG